MLMHHAHAARDGLPRTVIRDPLAAQIDFAVGRRVNAVEQVHQRRFSGAVFPDQRKDLALPDGQGNVVVGQNAGEFHAHMAEFHCRFHSYVPLFA